MLKKVKRSFLSGHCFISWFLESSAPPTITDEEESEVVSMKQTIELNGATFKKEGVIPMH